MLGKSAAGSLEKGLSGTYDVPSGAAIAEKVHQLSLRCELSAQITVWPDTATIACFCSVTIRGCMPPQSHAVMMHHAEQVLQCCKDLIAA